MVNLKFSRKAISVGESKTHLCIEVVPPEIEEVSVKPNLFLFVLDTSGSMGSSIVKPSRIGSGVIRKNKDLFNHQNPYGHSCIPMLMPNAISQTVKSVGVDAGTNLGIDLGTNIGSGYGTPLGNGLSYKSPSAINGNVDYSNSTTEEISTKLDMAKEAMVSFLNRLTEQDAFGLISFNSSATLRQPLADVSQSNVNKIIKNIKELSSFGGTCISDALVLADKLITEEELKKYNCKIILLSDGETNQGISSVDGLSDLSRDIFNRGITITTLGVGRDYNTVLMDAISTAAGGLFYHIDQLNKLKDCFEAELQNSSTIKAKSAEVVFKIPQLIEVSENLNKFSQIVKNDSIEVVLGNISNKKEILFELTNDFQEEDVEIEVVFNYKTVEDCSVSEHVCTKLEVVRKEDLDKIEVNEEVVKKVVALLQSSAIMKSTIAFETGAGLDDIYRSLNTSKSEMSNLTQSYNLPASSVESSIVELNSLETAYATGEMSLMAAKNMYATSRAKQK